MPDMVLITCSDNNSIIKIVELFQRGLDKLIDEKKIQMTRLHALETEMEKETDSLVIMKASHEHAPRPMYGAFGRSIENAGRSCSDHRLKAYPPFTSQEGSRLTFQ